MHFPIALLSDSIHTGFEGSNDESFSVTKEQKYLCEGCSSPGIPMNERVKHIIKDYPHWLEDIDNLYKILGYLKQFCGNKNVEYWKSLVEKREWETFVKSLLTHIPSIQVLKDQMMRVSL
jgi:hypothetical protein